MVVVDVGVDLGGGDVGVAQDFLYGAEVGAALEEVGAEAVSEGVRGEAAGDAGGVSGVADDAPDIDA